VFGFFEKGSQVEASTFLARNDNNRSGNIWICTCAAEDRQHFRYYSLSSRKACQISITPLYDISDRPQSLPRTGLPSLALPATYSLETFTQAGSSTSPTTTCWPSSSPPKFIQISLPSSSTDRSRQAYETPPRYSTILQASSPVRNLQLHS
jgi:hypothetical protein